MPNPNEVMDVEARINRIVTTHVSFPRDKQKQEFLRNSASKQIHLLIAQQNAALLRELLSKHEFNDDYIVIPKAILEAKLNEITEEVI